MFSNVLQLLLQPHSLSFDGDAIIFECRYSRSVHTNSDMSVSRPDPDVTSSHGDLTYNMNIVPGKVGGESVINITPNHNVAGIGARYVNLIIMLPTPMKFINYIT